MIPKIKDYRFQSINANDQFAFPISLNVILDKARKTDNLGKRSKWFMEGGDERKEADRLYRSAIRMAFALHGDESLETAKVLKEAA